ncbi:hypothetical protein [Streptomyces sp. NPDC058739]|uniref:hypothetical protein n=1 Tax=Streptomyces sp. NPDC058739 TaxID=3346618 RepID=UPI00369F124A
MSAAVGRVGRYYTIARRHPWVLGKVADWRIPLGPYTPAQITVAVGGGFLLFKTISWWSWMGPVPVAGWLLAVWAVRRPKIRGRAPLQAMLGWILLARQPAGGRIGGRPARDRGPRLLLGGFTIEDTPAPAGTPTATGTSAPRPASRTAPSAAIRQRPQRSARASRPRMSAAAPPVRRPAPAAAAPVRGPASGVQRLLARGERSGGGVR